MKISTRLISLRAQQGVSRYYIAKKTGISATQLGKYEHDIVDPNLETLSKIVSALNCTLAEFFNEDKSAIYPSEAEKELIRAYRSLSPSQQDAARHMIRELSKANHQLS